MDVHLIPAFADNYIYLFRDPKTAMVGVVDPGEAAPVLAALDRLGWKPDVIFNTHHHPDHVGGNRVLKQRFDCMIVGPRAERERIPGLDVELSEGQTWGFGGQDVRCIEVPGHTLGHIAFWLEKSSILFSGDTLFVMGCGRMFEGTAEQMWSSLRKLRGLPPETRFYCGHEYTLSNARFAASIEPGNGAVGERLARIASLRDAGQPTVPSTIGEERVTNPFLRADDPALQAAVGMAGADPVRVLAEIRQRKNSFK